MTTVDGKSVVEWIILAEWHEMSECIGNPKKAVDVLVAIDLDLPLVRIGKPLTKGLKP